MAVRCSRANYSVVDGLGRRTQYDYSPFGSVVRTLRPDGADDRVIFDDDENLTEIINSLGEVTKLDLDENCRATKITFFDGRTLEYSYDDRNQVTQCTDAAGGTTYLSYDGAGNAETVKLPDGSILEYVYDGVERLKSIDFTPVDHSRTHPHHSAFKFTSNNYVAEETHDDYSVHYQYDLANNLTGITDSLGREIEYRLGRWGTVVGIEDGDRSYEMEYSATGEMTKLRLPNRMVQKYEYDACSRLIHRQVLSATGRLVAWRRYRYDAAGQLVESDDWARGRVEFQYDLRGRLIGVLRGGKVSEKYEYDSESNLLSSPDYHFARMGKGNRINAADATTFQYDANGRLTTRVDAETRFEFRYNVRDQLSTVTRNGTLVAEYDYDLVGKRTHKVLAHETIRFYHHVNVLSSQISSVFGRSDFLFLPFTFLPLAETHNNHSYYYSCDQVGVPTEVWGEGGGLVATVDALAFGNKRVVDRVPNQEPIIPFHFMGQYVDLETSLHYNRFRYYYPPTGSFITQDPFGLAAGLNLYSYPRNPLNWVDPLGLQGLTLEIKCTPSDPPPFLLPASRRPCRPKSI